VLELVDVHTYYGQTRILNNLSLTVPTGQIVGLLGRNGMGKSTTIRTILGLTPPRRGQVRLHGQDISGLAPFQIARRGIGVVPQGRRVFGSLTVEQHIRVVSRRHQGGLDDAFRLFPELRPLATRKAAFLSGGEQQMLAFARALAVRPQVLLLDEPTEGLAPVIVDRLAAAIRGLAADGIGILLVEQNVSFAEQTCHQIHLLSKGEVMHTLSAEEFRQRPDLQLRYIGISE
jgi:branched-chain amino acid transport system ATP-binding protein